MSSTAVMAGNPVKHASVEVVAPKTGSVNLVSGMVFLVIVSAVWASLVVGFHFLELYVVGAH